MKRGVWRLGAALVLLVGLGLLAGLGLRLGWQRWRLPGEARPGGRPVAAWLEQLRSPDPAEGTRAAEALADLGSTGLPVLLEARKDGDVRAHRRAAAGLVRLGADAAEPLVKDLPRGGERVEVILVRLGPAALPALEQALREPATAPHAARVLGHMGSRARPAVGALTALLLDGSAAEEARAAAAQALGAIGPEEPDAPPERLALDPVIGPLTGALSGPSAVRRASAQALAELGPAATTAVPYLARLSREKEPDLAAVACKALGATRAPAAAAPLLARLQQADEASPAAASGLARLGPSARAAVAGLIASLASKKADARLARAVLERLGPVAVPGLVIALKEDDAATRRGAAEVLGLLGPRAAAAVPAVAACLEDRQPAVAVQAAQALVRIAPERAKEALSVLVAALLRKDVEVAATAAGVLAGLGAEARPALPVLVTALEAANDRVAIRAAAVLGRLGPVAREASTALTAVLNRPAIRPHAAVALARVDVGQRDEMVKALLADLEKARDPLRSPALAALAEIRPLPPEVLPALRPLLGEERSAAAALAVLEGVETKALREVVADLVALLGSRDARLRGAAGGLLARVGAVARPSLEAALKSASPILRATAAQALTNRVVVLRPLLDDPDPLVRQAAAETIATVGADQDTLREPMRALLGSPEAELRRAAARLPRSRRNFESWTPYLLECLFDPDVEVRRQATLSLPMNEEVRPALRGLLDDPAAAVRLAAARRLGSGKELLDLARRALPGDRAEVLRGLLTVDPAVARGLLGELEADLRADDLGDRLDSAEVLIALDATRAAEVLPFVLGILEGWDEGARLRAARTLQVLGRHARPAVPALRRRLERDDSDAVREAARRALEAIR
jgi:HEAT repeat protein